MRSARDTFRDMMGVCSLTSQPSKIGAAPAVFPVAVAGGIEPPVTGEFGVRLSRRAAPQAQGVQAAD
jgi:hypothetical protein